MSTGAQPEVVLRGVPGAPGRASGPVLLYRATPALQNSEKIANSPTVISAEQSRVRAALERAHDELLALAGEVEKRIGPEEALIFEAQAAMSADPTLADRASELVESDFLPAEAALAAAAEEQAAILASLDDEYLQARAADLRDVGTRAARALLGGSDTSPLNALSEPVIILADDLTPSETVKLDRNYVLGIALAHGGPTSHAAILARALEVPLVCGLDGFPEVEGAVALLDGDAGQLALYPSAGRLAEYEEWRAVRQKTLSRQIGLRDLEAESTDGRRIRLAANVGSVGDAQSAARYGAEGIGLLRTEFLFLDHEPGEQEQFEAYSQIFGAMPGREIVVRTMDLGGDKPPPYLDFGIEPNPFLGWRGLRVALDRPDLLQTQVRAVLRAGAGSTVCLMFPMVSTPDEFRRARSIVDEAKRHLDEAGVPSAGLQLGIMIEVPSAALMSEALAEEVDFFSIGTNDLTQYTMAADRGATRVAHLYSPLQPAVLKLIKMAVQSAHARGKWVGICGEAGGNPEWAALWLGLGLDELSMVAPAVPAVKEVIRRWSYSSAREMADEALSQRSVEGVERVMASAEAANRGRQDVRA